MLYWALIFLYVRTPLIILCSLSHLITFHMSQVLIVDKTVKQFLTVTVWKSATQVLHTANLIQSQWIHNFLLSLKPLCVHLRLITNCLYLLITNCFLILTRLNPHVLFMPCILYFFFHFRYGVCSILLHWGLHVNN